MEILAGIMLTLAIECLAYIAWRGWRDATTPDRPPQPQTPGQRANEAAFYTDQTTHPRVVSLRVQRATKRGRRAKIQNETSE